MLKLISRFFTKKNDPIKVDQQEVIKDKIKKALAKNQLASSQTADEILLGINFHQGKAMISLAVSPEIIKEKGADLEWQRQKIEQEIAAIDGLQGAVVILTSQKVASPPAHHEAQHAVKQASNNQSMSSIPAKQSISKRTSRLSLDGVKTILAVASGKGGVGKSTVTANLAVSLAMMGKTVGVLDADIYGPSIPKLFGVTEPPEILSGQKTSPPTAHGVKIMSMGFLVGEETPMIWRGPMVTAALMDMLREVKWAPLDILLIDMPPGTGDIQLTISQQLSLSGAVIVSTPQDLALIDARKAIAMFEQVKIPVVGLIENMSTFICPHCNQSTDIFSHGGASSEAEKKHITMLGEIALASNIRRFSDKGTPVTIQDPQSKGAQQFQSAAAKLLDSLYNQKNTMKPAPTIIIEE